uniref:Glycine zipper 2TM domain-containing protein n=1 Tax=Pseudomonas phage RVTF4 TaxID=3236931 RepID=A0AB39CCG5_9VIRU
MKKSLAFALAFLVATAAHANQIVDQQSAYVEGANCVQVGQNESMVGGLVGGALGTAGGALVGSLFGKSGKSIGAIAGGLGGAAYGASGNKIYNCTVMARLRDGEKVMVTKQTEQVIQQGETMGVVKLSNGFWQAI